MKEGQEMQIFNNLFGHDQNYEAIFFAYFNVHGIKANSFKNKVSKKNISDVFEFLFSWLIILDHRL